MIRSSLTVLFSAVLLAGCGTTSLKPDAPITQQALSSTFTRKGVTLEYDCSWADRKCAKGTLTGIEVTATVPSFGATEANREVAFSVAENLAKAKLARFLNEDVASSNVVTVVAKSLEKAQDKLLSGSTDREPVSMTDQEALTSNGSTRENSTSTSREVVETIRLNSAAILRGVRVVDERIVDRQTVQTTIRWDPQSNQAAKSIRSQMQSK